MFQQLIASRPDTNRYRLAGSAGAAVVAHVLCIGAVVLATLRPQSPAQAAPPPVLLAWPSEPLPHDPGLPPLPAPTPSPDGIGGGIISGPPIGLPPIGAPVTFAVSEWLQASKAVGPHTPIGDGVDGATVGSVEEPPVLLAARGPAYPELLRAAGITGRVVVQVIVDTSGRAEPGSVTVLASDNPGFDAAARSYIQGALFRPGRMHGGAVRVQVRVPIIFELTPGGY